MKNNKVNKKGSSRFKLVLKVVLLLAASLLICATAYGIYLTKKAEHAANTAFEELDERDIPELREAKVEPADDNVSVLFVGVDDSEKRGQGADNSRSDALLLATLNNKTKTVKLLSIPRDSYVYIPYVGYKDKITHAHAFGSTLATIETVEELFDIPVDYYFRLNFEAFIEIVDALGGVEVDVPYKLNELDENDKRTVNLQPGLQKLNGSEALAFARTRKLDSDIERGKRQQEVIKAIADKASSFTSITKYDNILEAVGNNMKTNMSFKEMKSFFSYLTEGMPRIDALTLEGYDDMSTGTYYYKLNEDSLEETKEILQNHLGLNSDSTDLTSTDSSSSEHTSTDDDAEDSVQ